MARTAIGTIIGRGAPTLILVGLILGGCQGGPRDLGSSCDSDDECVERMCLAKTCQAPDGDADGDGLSNVDELKLGTDPLNFDSDNDQISDEIEVGDPSAPLDSDGDGKIDALESALADADLDCIRDQYDPQDALVETDANVVRDANCYHEGVCGASLGTIVVTCDLIDQNGETVAEATCDYGLVEGYQADPETACDGTDNDCDGEIDEGLAYVQDDGGVRTIGESCFGYGACLGQTGTVECGRAAEITCSVNSEGSSPKGSAEVLCDDVDNDCNGIIDDGVYWIDPTTGERRRVGETCEGRGVCGLGVVECDAEGSHGICSSESGGSTDQSLPEACDGFDNDCDGEVDEDQNYVDLDGSILELGADCGLGVCGGGQVVCVDDVAACTTQDKASGGSELCNGIDDDCDGEVDEVDGLRILCSTQGVCSKLEVVDVNCDGETTMPACEYEEALGLELGVEESCDGLDNDCDGEIDEDVGYVNEQGTAQGLGESCTGLGACSELPDGVVECGAFGEVVCSANLLGGQIETCNGVDDDCDGTVDELDPMAQPKDMCKIEGVCALMSAVPASCIGGVWQCPYEDGDTFEAAEMSCDGLDNDCDGWVDEGTPKDFTGVVSVVSHGQPAERIRWRLSPQQQGLAFLFGGWFLGASQGGEPQVQLLDDFWRYEADTEGWKKHASGPPGRADHAISFDSTNDILIVHGGVVNPTLDPSGLWLGGDAREDMWIYELESGTWLPVAQEWSMLPGDGPVTRRLHSITDLGNGSFLLHGGTSHTLFPPERITLRGSLKKAGANGGWLCFWETVGAETNERKGHSAVYDATGDRVVVVGGISKGALVLPFIELFDVSNETWTSLEIFDLTPPHRLYPALTTLGSVAIIHGGEAPGDQDGLQPVTDTFLLDLGADSVVKVSPSSPPPPMRGASFVPSWAGVVELVGGFTDGDQSTRASWQLTLAKLEWSEGTPWKGPVPRLNATLVARKATSELWLIGGTLSTALGENILMEAWKLDNASSTWQEMTPSTPFGTAEDAPESFPVGGVGVYDATNERILIYGRTQNGDNDALWAFSPETKSFSELAPGGSLPPMMDSPNFIEMEDEGAALLCGLFLGNAFTYRLDLATLEWSPVIATGSAPAQSLGLVAGLSEGKLRAAALQSDQSLAFYTLDLTDNTWSKLGSVAPPSGITEMVAAGFDSASQKALLILRHSQDQIKTWVADFNAASLYPLEAWWPLEKAGSQIVFHPNLGAVGVGGKQTSGQVVSTTYGFEQSCTN